MLKKFLFSLAFILSSVSAIAQSDLYLPQIHGVFRGRWEMEPESGLNRFQVRNARLTVSGKIAAPIEYFFQTDLCDQGKMKILDAYGKVNFSAAVALQAGQFRMPFGVETFRAPLNYIFANRSFIGKQVCNYRAVGAKLMVIPAEGLTLEAGAFNPTVIGDHNVWVKTLAYAGKATLKKGEVTLSAGVQSLSPDSVRINVLDGAAGWSHGRWNVNGEYMHKHYTHKTHKSAHSYVFWADYRMPVAIGIFNSLSFEGRFDGMTAHSSGKRDNSKKLSTTDPARNRVTIGSTLSYIKGSVHCDLRLNYEKYFYHSGVTVPVGENDKIVAEMVIRF